MSCGHSTPAASLFLVLASPHGGGEELSKALGRKHKGACGKTGLMGNDNKAPLKRAQISIHPNSHLCKLLSQAMTPEGGH